MSVNYAVKIKIKIKTWEDSDMQNNSSKCAYKMPKRPFVGEVKTLI